MRVKAIIRKYNTLYCTFTFRVLSLKREKLNELFVSIVFDRV